MVKEDDAGPIRNGADGEGAEFRRMLDGFSVAKVVQAVASSEGTEGRERELQQHLGIGAHSIPIQSLAPERRGEEHRAAATFTGDTPNTTPRDIIAQVFPESIAAFAGIMGETVAAGEAIYPVITTGASVHRPAGSAAAGESTAAIGVTTLAPQRIQASFAYQREDAAVFANLDSALRMNLRDALQDDLDDFILNKTNAGLLHFGSNPAATPTAETTGAAYLAAMYAGVDGTYAQSIAQVRMIVGSEIYAHMAAQVPSGRDDSALDILTARSGGIRVSGNVAAYSQNRQDAVIIKGMGRVNAVAPVWQGIQIFQDEFTRASGRRNTAVWRHAGANGGPAGGRIHPSPFPE